MSKYHLGHLQWFMPGKKRTHPVAAESSLNTIKVLELLGTFLCPILNLKDRGGLGGFCPEVRRLPAISYRIILWSQKFLTSSQLEGSQVIFYYFDSISRNSAKTDQRLWSKITKWNFFNFFITKSPNFISNLNDNRSQLSFGMIFV